jgi:hypothetical protein
MKNLILALNQANLSPDGIESVLTEMEVWIDLKVLRREQNLMIETIAPLKRETDGIRSEIRFLAETMKQGFALMDERLLRMDQKWDERFQKMDQKLDFTRKHLELQMKGLELQMESTRKNLEMQIASSQESLEMQINSTRKNLELQIASSRENLETQIKANDKQLGLVQKLLWLVLTLVLGLFARAVHLV